MSKSLSVSTGALGLLLLAGLAFASVEQQTPSMEEFMEQARPGPEHERLGALTGEWDVALVPAGSEAAEQTGAAEGQSLLGGRFLELGGTLGEGAAQSEFRFTLGFDRRHEEFSLVLIDSSGTYAVTARGPETDGLIRMRGSDDDPYMASLGWEKKYAFDLELDGGEAFAIKLHLVDTREQEEPLMEQYGYVFTRR